VDDTSPRVARKLLRQALESWGLPDDLVGDATLAVSELAANLVQHVMSGLVSAPGRPVPGGPELWLYRRWGDDRGQIVCKTFDPQRAWRRNPPPAPLDERGRGLTIVDAIAQDWGCHLTRSVLGGPEGAVPGKAVWFAMDVPADRPSCERLTPVLAAGELESLLVARGVKAVHHRHGKHAVLSMRKGPAVWCEDQEFSWLLDREPTRLPFTDLFDAAERLVRIHEEHDSELLASS
jgi:anti-sigma regulatory factor (Ser/Thr protein kinase)